MKKGAYIRQCSRFICASGIVAFTICHADGGFAQDLVQAPISPTFGGNPFNSAHILGTATAQNDYRDPATAPTAGSQADLFARQLQSRLLSALSSQITDAIFGENPQERGTITFGDQTVSFVRSLEAVNLTITNNVTGEITNIEIPTFIRVP